ncbi:Ribosomal large subunit pseudouridine synthase B [Clavibacter michiganensis subsp. michiganensis]|uniref:RNA pseudouridylate synthase n=1 Tax=Clavibacter michiganensis subsp. michiganensis TaxID=33013 RepID=A0A251XI30_CLAMM|nr:Ribosomal large subunit pseudouridine synthase B [Clavibacter michiganensis subsp. michiganensis]OUE02452.1 Ribosomal large subunit pseudouridine synthase B [Clavibacter michiganensis subsp. michiganensis]
MTPSSDHAWNPDEPVQGVRLQKVMAAAGVASRRVCEDMIAAGRVTVNGEVVTEPGRRIDPDVDEVAVDDQAVQLDTSKRYLMLNKPVGSTRPCATSAAAPTSASSRRSSRSACSTSGASTRRRAAC